MPPPDGWSNWQQVRQIRADLQKHRFLLLRRPDRLNTEEQQQVAGNSWPAQLAPNWQ